MNIFKLNLPNSPSTLNAALRLTWFHISTLQAWVKSSIIKAFCTISYVIDIRSGQPSDMSGFLYLLMARLLTFHSMWQLLLIRSLSQTAVVIFFDEFHSAPKSVQCTDPLLDPLKFMRSIAPETCGLLRWKSDLWSLLVNPLKVRWFTSGAGGGITIFGSVALPQKYDNRGYFPKSQSEELMAFDHQDKTFPCPRTWEFNSADI